MRLSLTYIIDIKESKTTLNQVKYFHIKTKKYHKPGIHLLPMLYIIYIISFLCQHFHCKLQNTRGLRIGDISIAEILGLPTVVL